MDRNKLKIYRERNTKDYQRFIKFSAICFRSV